MAALVAIAPSTPRPIPQVERGHSGPSGPFQYLPDKETYALDLDPRLVRFDLLEGWDREQEAYRDRQALAFVSGPMYERLGVEGKDATVPLGDLKLGQRIWRGPNRSASRQRAFVGIRQDGQIEFGFGELSPERARQYDTFIGGLHSVYNELQSPPADYKGAYSISMGQQIRYFLPRIRVIFGLRPDGRLAVLMSRDGLTLEQTRDLARSRGFLAAYLPDHASKSRFIIPGIKGFSEADANWISGGATSFVHVPYMLRLSQRPHPLQGSLLSVFNPTQRRDSCGTPLQCSVALMASVADRAMAGFNRVMEQGVEPLARLIWAPHLPAVATGPDRARAPLREPVITADPASIQARQQRDLAEPAAEAVLPPIPQLPPPASGSGHSVDATTVGTSDAVPVISTGEAADIPTVTTAESRLPSAPGTALQGTEQGAAHSASAPGNPQDIAMPPPPAAPQLQSEAPPKPTGGATLRP